MYPKSTKLDWHVLCNANHKITGLLQNELNVWDSSTQFFFNLSPTDDLVGVIEGEKTRMAKRETKIASS